MYLGYCVVCHQAISKEVNVCPACGNKTFTPEHKTAPELIIDRAKHMSKEYDCSFEAALGDVIGGLVYEIDAQLHPTQCLPTMIGSEFYENLMRHLSSWFDKE